MIATATLESSTVIAIVRRGREERQTLATSSNHARKSTSRIAYLTRPALRRAARAVADAADGHDDARVVGAFLHLAAQALHVQVHEAGVGLVVVAPDLLEQQLAREHLLRLEREGEQ